MSKVVYVRQRGNLTKERDDLINRSHHDSRITKIMAENRRSQISNLVDRMDSIGSVFRKYKHTNSKEKSKGIMLENMRLLSNLGAIMAGQDSHAPERKKLMPRKFQPSISRPYVISPKRFSLEQKLQGSPGLTISPMRSNRK